MSILYLHIGTPKTGTTAIQYFLQQNRRRLAKNGYYFPDMKVRFPDVPEKRNAHFLISDSVRKQETCFELLFRLLKKYPNVILSDEMIWHACNRFDNFWAQLSQKIADAGHQLKVIVYLRRQDEFIQSYWKYKVLSTETSSFEKYLASSKYRFFPLDYYSHLSKIADGIQKENLIVRVYEREQYMGENQTLISDFLYSIGLPFTGKYKVSEKLQNPNIDYICTEVKRRLNSMPEFQDKNTFLRKYMATLSKQNEMQSKYQVSSLFFEREQQDAFLTKYEEENRKTAEEFLGRTDGRLFYASIRYATEGQVRFSAKDYLQICGQIFLQMEKAKPRFQLHIPHLPNLFFRRGSVTKLKSYTSI